MLSPEMERALLQTSRDAWASFHALALPEDAMLCIAETFRPLIADLEAKVQAARAEAWEEGMKAKRVLSPDGGPMPDIVIVYPPNPYALAQTQPPDVSKEI